MVLAEVFAMERRQGDKECRIERLFRSVREPESLWQDAYECLVPVARGVRSAAAIPHRVSTSACPAPPVVAKGA
jgi:hypothetical protein